ncbi:MAG: hypothetical protein ACR2MN_12810 [Acidimicrobiales bacterium]
MNVNNPLTRERARLMIEHVAIAIITTALLLALAPAGRRDSADPASRPAGTWTRENVPAR